VERETKRERERVEGRRETKEEKEEKELSSSLMVAFQRWAVFISGRDMSE
jgi:hypothetical protein